MIWKTFEESPQIRLAPSPRTKIARHAIGTIGGMNDDIPIQKTECSNGRAMEVKKISREAAGDASAAQREAVKTGGKGYNLNCMEDVLISLRTEKESIVRNMHMVHRAGIERLAELDAEIRKLKSNRS